MRKVFFYEFAFAAGASAKEQQATPTNGLHPPTSSTPLTGGYEGSHHHSRVQG
jgi:hypothetical protein